MTQARFRTKIRRARAGDMPKIICLGRKTKEFICSSKAKFYSKDEFENLLKQSRQNVILVIFKDDEFAGFLCAKIMSIYWCAIDTIVIKENLRKFGLANLLLEYLYNILRKKNICYAQVLVGEEFLETKNFWKTEGFKEGKKLIWFDKYI